MPNPIKKLYYSAENIRGKQLYILLVSVFVFFMFIGFSLNYGIKSILKNPEFSTNKGTDIIKESEVQNSFSGIITYTDPRAYPSENISYYLADVSGKEIILLKSNDKKLEVSEGLFVTVTGFTQKLESGEKEYLMVDRITVSTK